MEFIKTLAPWVLPPLLGAIIGFITNAIAISMLFRPYKEKRIFKIRVPFTPGILPRQRYEFANSVGNMVQNQLLTEDALRKQTESESFKTSIYNYVSGFSGNLLNLTPSSIIEHVSTETQNDTLKELLKQFWDSVKKSSTVETLVADIVRFSLDYFGEKKLSDLKALGQKLSSQPSADLLSERNIKTAILFYVDTVVCNIIKADPSIGSILTEEREKKFLDTLEIAYPYLLLSLTRWLKQEKTFNELTFRGRIIVKNIINKLNILQKFFVTAGQYDKTIDDKMEEIIKDVITQIERSGNKQENKDHIFQSAGSELKVLRSKNLSDLIQKRSLNIQKTIHEIAETLIDSVINEFKKSPSLGPGILDSDQTIKNLVMVVTQLSWDELSENIGAAALNGILNVKTDGISKGIVSLLSQLFENKKNEQLGQLLNVNNNFKKSLDSYLTEQIINIINDKVPEILKSVNVRDLVIDKINSLDIKNVEKILLSVIQKHLKWINIFGALLGALIGMIQIISNNLL